MPRPSPVSAIRGASVAVDRFSAADGPTTAVASSGPLAVLRRLRAPPRRTPGRRAEIALVAVAFGAFLVLAFADVTVGDRTFAPNGRLATQTGFPTVDYPHEPPSRAVVDDGGAFSWFFEPMAVVVHDAYADGAFPLWNPHAGLGMPLAANFQSAPASPLVLPVVAHPSQEVWDLLLLLRLLVGGVGCFALLRALGAGPAPAFVAAVGYLLSSSFVLFLTAVSLTVEAFVPWLLLAVVGLVRRPGAARFAAVAALTAATALGGQPESLVVAAYLVIAWALYWWWREGRSPRVLLELLGAGLAGGLLAAPYLALFAEYVTLADDSHSGRLGDTRLESTRLPVMALGDFAAQREGAIGIGLLVLAVAGLAAGRRSGVAGGGILLAATLVLGVRMLGLPGASVVGLLPGIEQSNVVRYGRFVVVLAAAVLAAAGLQAVLRGSRRALVAAGAAAVGIPLLAALAGAGRPNIVPALLLAASLAVGLVVTARIPALVPVLALVLVVQFFLLTPREWARAYDPFVPRPFVSYLQASLEPGERVSATGSTLRPQYPSALGLPDPRVLDALFPQRLVPYMSELVASGERPEVRALRVLAEGAAASPFLEAAGVRFLVMPGGYRSPGPSWRAVYEDRSGAVGMTVWENAAAYPRAWSPRSIREVPDADAAKAVLLAGDGDLARVSVVEDPTEAMLAAEGSADVSVTELDRDELRLSVRADGPAVIVVSDQFYPGWEATVGGQPTEIRPANLAMRAVAVPDGEHELVFRYRPRVFLIGLLLAGVGVASLLGRSLVPPAARRLRRTP